MTAEVFGKGIDMWLKSQGDWLKLSNEQKQYQHCLIRLLTEYKRTQQYALVQILKNYTNSKVLEISEMNMQNVVLEKDMAVTSKDAGEIKVRMFAASIDLNHHPLIKSKVKLRAKYYAVLEYFVKQCVCDPLVEARLGEYKKVLLRDNAALVATKANKNSVIKGMLTDLRKPWMRKYRYLLLCDLALVLVDEGSVHKVFTMLESYFSKKQLILLGGLRNSLLADEHFSLCHSFTQNVINQYRANRKFWEQDQTRFIVTANMSSGKSTLINALVGKVISGMKSEAFTAAIHYIYDKPFEDGRSSEWDGVLVLDADDKTLMDYDVRNSTGKIYVATYFSTFVSKDKRRFCFIDTPGANSAINREHGKLTRKSLREESYDRLLYVLNANRLGTDEEFRHLKVVAENVSKDKVIFVLNKLDDFNKKDDSIEESIEGVRKDLIFLGYENPTICPISAYFALLVKKKLNGEELSDDEQDSFELFAKKFSKSEYDLSRYYPPVDNRNSDMAGNELAAAAIKCGLYGLECTLYGGMSDNEKNIY